MTQEKVQQRFLEYMDYSESLKNSPTLVGRISRQVGIATSEASLKDEWTRKNSNATHYTYTVMHGLKNSQGNPVKVYFVEFLNMGEETPKLI